MDENVIIAKKLCELTGDLDAAGPYASGKIALLSLDLCEIKDRQVTLYAVLKQLGGIK